MKKSGKEKAKKGFTLTEMLITIGIIGATASLLMPALNGAGRKARDVECLARQRNAVVMTESIIDEAFPDYKITLPYSGDSANFDKLFFKSAKIIPDPFLKDYGFFVAKDLTCPYAFGDGKSRASFMAYPVNYEVQKQVSRQNYVSYTYNIDFMPFFKFGEGYQKPNRPLVFDMPNYDRAKKVNLSEIHGIKEYPKIEVTFNESVLHRHKGRGCYVTFRAGHQKWVKAEDFVNLDW